MEGVHKVYSGRVDSGIKYKQFRILTLGKGVVTQNAVLTRKEYLATFTLSKTNKNLTAHRKLLKAFRDAQIEVE